MVVLPALFTALLYFVCSSDAVGEGAVRLVRFGYPTTTQAWSAGIVEYYHEGVWGNICDDSTFSLDEADVICHQLGYSGASSYTNTLESSIYGTDNARTVLQYVSCSSDYLALSQCYTSSTFSSCNSGDVIVTCHSTRIWESPTSGDIRLTGGTYSNEGLLEVYCSGEWGTVCDDTFYSTQATVACAQLGYNSYVNYDHLSQRGTSSQKIWLNSLYDCSSYDTCLTYCQNCPTTDVSGCTHSEDITLECEHDSSSSNVYTTTYHSCENIDLTGLATAALIAVIVGGLVCCFICILIISVPFCICCCLGVGIGAAARSSGPRTTVVAAPPQSGYQPTPATFEYSKC